MVSSAMRHACHQVGSTIVRLQEDAKGIKEALTVVHSEHRSRQTSKILSDFEVHSGSAQSDNVKQKSTSSLRSHGNHTTCVDRSVISCDVCQLIGEYGAKQCHVLVQAHEVERVSSRPSSFPVSWMGVSFPAGHTEGLSDDHAGCQGQGGGQPAQAARACPCAAARRGPSGSRG
jgi:hypothetical protein